MIHLYTNSGQEDTQVNTTYARPVENNASRVIKATEFAMSITGNNGGVSAYEGQGQNLQDIMKSAGAMDVTANRNYMTVMSNSLSDEDYEELVKEGYKPGETSVETTVTVVDEIKAKLAQSGVIIEGYNDDLSDEVLKEITGSESAANAVKKAFREADIPMTAKNVRNAAEAMQLAGEIQEITDGMCDYLLRNGIAPTIDHLYRVRFSGAEVSENMGGYYSDDIGGYMTKQSADYNWKSMEVRLSQTIENAGLTVNEETLQEAQWLVKSGILFNETNVKILHDLKGLQMPMSEDDIARSIANAIADGREAKDAYLNNTASTLTEAVQAYEDVQSFSFEAVKVVVESGKSLNIRELRVAMQSIRIEGTVSKDGVSLSVEASNASMEAVNAMTGGMANLTTAGVAVGNDNPDLVKAMRVLEETRLAMTVESNYRLMKLGYNIETTELSQLVEDLKIVEARKQNTLFPKDMEAAQKATLWQATNDKLVTLAFMPAATVGKIVQAEGVHTLSSVHDMGEVMRQDYLKAGEQYELLGTEVRKDLGDSIKKAFSNVDDILQDLNFDINDTNRRAVRILGYNSMEVTVSNIESVRGADAELQRIMNKMTPASTLQLIRDGVNPLETDLATLENQLDAYEATVEQTAEKYSKFLFKLEKNHEITPEERESYIGIYRLLHQIEKADGALVGNVLSQGAEMSFKNLLSAMRSGKSIGMDYCIDDTFGAQVRAAGYEFNISNQILKGFESAVIGSDEGNAEALAENLGELREILIGDHADAVEELMHYDQEVTPDNIQSMQKLLEAPDALQSAWSIFQNAAEGNKENRGFGKAAGGKDASNEVAADEAFMGSEEISALEEAVFGLQESFTDAESVQEAYGKLMEQAGSLLEESMMSDEMGRIDIKSMTTAYKQLSFTGRLMREENYEIPAYINGKLQGIRVKIVHKGESDGNVIATLSTEKYGNIVAQFRLTEEKVQGYIACDSEEGMEALKAEGRFEEKLAGAGKEAGDIRYLYSEKLDGTFLYRRHDKSASDGGSTRDLYETAKLFILSMQDTER